MIEGSGEITVGREKGNDVEIKGERGVSRRHARVKIDIERGEWSIEDLRSKYGT